jgi:hypothetical protein
MTVMSVIIVTPMRKPFIYAISFMTLTMTMK